MCTKNLIFLVACNETKKKEMADKSSQKVPERDTLSSFPVHELVSKIQNHTRQIFQTYDARHDNGQYLQNIPDDVDKKIVSTIVSIVRMNIKSNVEESSTLNTQITNPTVQCVQKDNKIIVVTFQLPIDCWIRLDTLQDCIRMIYPGYLSETLYNTKKNVMSIIIKSTAFKLETENDMGIERIVTITQVITGNAPNHSYAVNNSNVPENNKKRKFNN